MAFTHTVVSSYVTAEGNVSSTSISKTGDADASFDGVAIKNATTEVQIAVDKDVLKSFLLTSDKAVTVKTNSSTVPDNTFVLAANVPVIWNGSGTNPITVDVVKFFIVNASVTDDANVKIRALLDSTP